jgi:hypothetical protein
MTKKILIFGLVLILLSSFAVADLTDDNTLYYSLDNSTVTGTNVEDLSSEENNGTKKAVGEPIQDSNGLIFEANDFDGTDDYIRTSALSELQGAETWSISTWFNTDSLSPGASDIILSNSDGGDRLAIGIEDSEVVVAMYDGASWATQCGGNGCEADTTLSTGTWYHLVVVNTGWNNFKIYLNNIDQSMSGEAIANAGTSGDFGIGAIHDGAWSSFFNGKIDEVAVYNKTLTTDEIEELYNSGDGYNPYSVSAPSPSVSTSYNSTVFEDSTTEHTLTFENYNTTSNSTATLYWNGTEYNGTINYTAWNLTEFNTDVNIPITYSNNTAYDFYWEYNLTHNNGTQIISNTSIEQQNVLWNLTKFPRVNVTARDKIGDLDIQNFTITGGLNTPSTTNGEVYVRWNSTETVNLTFSSDGYATMSELVNFTSGNFSSHQFQIYTTNSINFTIRDEITDVLITDEVTIEFISDVASYNYTTNTGSKYVDLVTPANYTIRYSSDNYGGPRHVYLTVNNNTFQEQTLYLLNSTIGTETTFVVYDATTLTKLEGAVVSVQRYNQLDNVYTLIGSYTTDISGSAFFDLEHDTELYKILVEYPLGTLKYTSSPMYITSATNNVYIDLYEDPTTTYFNSKDITFSLDYVSATTTIDTTWVDSSAVASNYCLYVKKYGQYSNEVINSSCTTSNSASISLGGLTENTTYYGVLTATIGGEETNLGVVWQTFQDDQLDSGAFGVFMTILLFTMFAFLSMIHSYSVILAGTSLIFAKLLGILAIGWPMIITVLIGSIVLVIIVEMKK